MLFRLSYLFLAMAALFILGNCGSDDNPSSSGGGTVVKDDPSFADDIVTIFVAKGCAGRSCHGLSASAGLKLEPEVAHANLVDINSTEVPSLKRVNSGDAENSYIIHKVEGRQAEGDRMPPPPRQQLSAEEIQNIKNWINMGAKDN